MFKLTKKFSLFMAVLLLCFSSINVFAEDAGNGSDSTVSETTQSYGPINSIRASWANDSFSSCDDTSTPVRVNLAKKVGNWIYYNKTSYNYRLSRIGKTQGSKPVAYGDSTSSFVVSGQWIYYINGDDKGKLYRVKNDGTGKKKVCDERMYNFQVMGDWIIFINPGKEDTLYKVKGDGTAKPQVLINAQNVNALKVFENTVVYNNPKDEYKPYVVSIDGKSNKKLIDMYISVGALLYSDGWFLYQDYDAGGKLVKVKPDGTKKSILVNEAVSSTGVSKGWVYYSSKAKNYSLFRVKFDGTGNKKVSDLRADFFKIDGDYIYCKDGKSQSISRVKYDGSGKLKICDFNGYDFIAAKDFVYFIDDKEKSWVRVKADGKGKKEKVTQQQIAVALDKTNNKWVWYSETNVKDAFCRVDSVSNKKQSIVSGEYFGYTLYRDYVYYQDQSALYRTKLDGTGTTKLYSGLVDSFKIDNGWVYFSRFENNGGVGTYRVKAEGSSTAEKLNIISNSYIENIYNGWIYYKVWGITPLYRKNLDKGVEEKIAENVTEWNMTDGYVFYTTENSHTLMCRPADGNEDKVLLDGETDSVTIDNGWVYYNNEKDNGFVYRVKYDGSQKEIVFDKKIYPEKIISGTIFYRDYDEDKLYAVKAGETSDKTLALDGVLDYKLSGDTIYYISYKENGLLSIKTDGTGKKKFSEEVPMYTYYNAAGDWLFFIKWETCKADTYRIKVDGTNIEKL